jgi:AMP-polyphosphate phosphotransferase
MVKRKQGRLAALDHSVKLAPEAYEDALAKLQRRLSAIQQAYFHAGLNAVIVFEGWDAAGKGGVIRRLTAALDPRGFRVWPIGPPRRYHAERHYLTRFWEKLPPKGGISIFDRSWYGRLLVERVEKITPEARWRAAFEEINEFERLLIEDGTRVVKIFLCITPEEQLRRFEARLRDPLKRWKLSSEDFRNREDWDGYAEAAEEAIERTSRHAPWTVLSSENKKAGRIAAIGAVVEQLSEGVDLSPPPLCPTTIEAAQRHFAVPPDALRAATRRRR